MKDLESKYIMNNRDHHVVKLENFKKKIFAVGVKEDYSTEDVKLSRDDKL